MEAVNSGDMETAQRMVDEAAKAAGYNIRAYRFSFKDASSAGATTLKREKRREG